MFTLLLLLCVLAPASPYMEKTDPDPQTDLDLSFDQFIIKFDKNYRNEGEGAEIYQYRKSVYEQNVAYLKANPC